MADITVPKKRRRLSELYQSGKLVVINDETDGDPAVVWIKKLSDLEQRKCLDKSAHIRTQYLLMERKKDHAGRDKFVEQLIAYSLDAEESLIGFIVGGKLLEVQQSHESRISEEEEWSKDNYLESLRTLWQDEGLEKKYELNPEDEDAKRVYEELKRFSDQVEEAVAAERDDMIESMRGRPYEDLLSDAVDQLIQTESNVKWIEEFHKWRLFFCVKDPEDHRVPYFEDVEEIEYLPTDVIVRLQDEVEAINVTGLEGKD